MQDPLSFLDPESRCWPGVSLLLISIIFWNFSNHSRVGDQFAARLLNPPLSTSTLHVMELQKKYNKKRIKKNAAVILNSNWTDAGSCMRFNVSDNTLLTNSC